MSAAPTRAVLFDFGGTLYDYASLQAAERESLLDLARWAGIEAGEVAVLGAYRDSMKRVFRAYLAQSYYYHRDLFRDALSGTPPDQPLHVLLALEAKSLRAHQWERLVGPFGDVWDFLAFNRAHPNLGSIREQD